MKKTLSENLEDIQKKRKRSDRVAMLQRVFSEHKSFYFFLKLVLSSKVEWLVEVPERIGKPHAEEKYLRHKIYGEVRNFGRFVNVGPYPNLSRERRTSLFKSMLESIHPEDAALMMFCVRERALPQSNVTKEIVQEAFPQIDLGEEKTE